MPHGGGDRDEDEGDRDSDRGSDNGDGDDNGEPEDDNDEGDISDLNIITVYVNTSRVSTKFHSCPSFKVNVNWPVRRSKVPERN